MSKQRTKLIGAVLAICVGLAASSGTGEARPGRGGGGTGGGTCWGCDNNRLGEWPVQYCARGYLFGYVECENTGGFGGCDLGGGRCAGTIVVGNSPALL